MANDRRVRGWHGAVGFLVGGLIGLGAGWFFNRGGDADVLAEPVGVELILTEERVFRNRDGVGLLVPEGAAVWHRGNYLDSEHYVIHLYGRTGHVTSTKAGPRKDRSMYFTPDTDAAAR